MLSISSEARGPLHGSTLRFNLDPLPVPNVGFKAKNRGWVWAAASARRGTKPGEIRGVRRGGAGCSDANPLNDLLLDA